jgi:Ribbon-helix-helix protein, copG family
MSMYERRLQILIDEPRYRRLAALARARKVSVAEVVREAIDVALPADADRRARAGRRILAAEPMPVPATVEELKRELEQARSAVP